MTFEDGQKPGATLVDRDFVMPPEYRDTDGFLAELFDRAGVMFRVERGAQIRAEFGPQEIPRWDTRKDYKTLLMEKGVLLTGEGNRTYGLALGHRGYKNPDRTRIQLQFGVVPSTVQSKSDLELLGMMLSRSNNRGAGRIYQNTPLRKIVIESWADGLPFGGKLVGNWYQEDILTERGLRESLDVIRQHTLRAF